MLYCLQCSTMRRLVHICSLGAAAACMRCTARRTLVCHTLDTTLVHLFATHLTHCSYTGGICFLFRGDHVMFLYAQPFKKLNFGKAFTFGKNCGIILGNCRIIKIILLNFLYVCYTPQKILQTKVSIKKSFSCWKEKQWCSSFEEKYLLFASFN